MKKIKENRAVLIGLSILAAVVIWLMVDSGTKVTKTFEHVQVEYVGEETTLASRGLMLIQSDEPQEVTLEVQGGRFDVAQIDPSEVKVVVDLSSVTSVGTQSLTYRVVYTSNNKLASRLTTKSSSPSSGAGSARLFTQVSLRTGKGIDFSII